MTRSAGSDWLSSFIRAASATGRVLGIAVGGSHGRGTADEHSDVDLFFLVTPAELTALFRTPPAHLTELLPGHTAVTYPALVPEFGLKYTVMSSEIGLCDLFFEDETGFPTPLREGTEFRWDPDGTFNALNDALLAESHEPGTRAAHATRMAVLLASEYAGATKSVARGRAIQARYRLSKVVNLLLGVRRLDKGFWWFGHCVADEAFDDPATALSAQVSQALAEEAPGEVHRLLGGACVEAIEQADGLPANLRRTLVSQVNSSIEAIGSG
ncbi:nucleotidyltransferase domain-containing protein [Actinomadura syzygii]|uniref:nucleotidyltransferase domain-containing protein n=1 Tax=Actinomadura syzygii TaxID=1427538 RepID=UPI0016529CBB|nr:nucleotidyltransferase domain-containing protein [Actinomadura syzygii]